MAKSNLYNCHSCIQEQTPYKCLFETSHLYRYYTVFMKQSKQQLHYYLYNLMVNLH